MSAIQSIAAAQSTASTSGASASSSTASASASDSQDRFLKLLVAQLQNQDPMNPLDNAAITSQMAQISTVSGIEKLNTTLQSLTTQGSVSQQLQAASLVGHQILYSGTRIDLSGKLAGAGFTLDQPVNQLTVTIMDASGSVLHKVDLGAQQAGMHTFQWDGQTDSGQQAADGAYTFSVTAMAAGKPITPQTLALGSVFGIRNGDASSGNSPLLDLGGQGTALLADVKQIY